MALSRALDEPYVAERAPGPARSPLTRNLAYLAGGQLEVSSGPSGTLVQARLPMGGREVQTPEKGAQLSGLSEP